MEVVKTTTGEQLYQKVLDNGLRVYVMTKPGFQKKYAVFSTKYGSFDSKFKLNNEIIEVPDGIAHFLEHKLFEDQEMHVFERFAQYGASVNAYTSYTMTSYLFSTIEYFDEAFQELLSFVQKPYFTSENVEKEKGIIEQELKMYEDHPDRKIYNNLLEALYHVHPIRIDVGGTVESIQKITVDLLNMCYETFYQPSNMAVFVIGDLEPTRVFDLAAEHTVNWFFKFQEIQRIYPEEPVEILKPSVEERLSVSRPRYYLGFKNQPYNAGRALMKQQLAMSMIWRTIAARSSPVYQELYSSGLIDESFGASFSATPEYALSIVGGETDQPEKLDQRLRQAIQDLQKNKLQVADVERMKRRALGNYLASFNSLEYIANSFLSHEFNGTSILDFPQILEEITVDEINEILNDGLDLKNSAVSILLPE